MFTLRPLYNSKREHDISYDELSQKTGLPRATLCRILKSNQGMNVLENISKICKALGVDEKSLIKEDEE